MAGSAVASRSPWIQVKLTKESKDRMRNYHIFKIRGQSGRFYRFRFMFSLSAKLVHDPQSTCMVMCMECTILFYVVLPGNSGAGAHSN